MRLTKKVIDGIAVPASGQAFYRDSEIRGFAVRITPTGRKVFIVERKINGKGRRMKIGTYPEITVDQARRKANEIISKIQLSKDEPQETEPDRKLRGITMDQVYSDYISERKLEILTLKGYEESMRLAFSDWRSRPLLEIDRDMVSERMQRLTAHSPSKANHHMRLLNALFNFAMGRYAYSNRHFVITENPVRVLNSSRAWNKISRRRTYIKPHQLPAWYQSVRNLGGIVPSSNDLAARDYLPLILFTGLRRDEAATLEWLNIDFDHRTLTVPDTKNHEMHVLPIPDFVSELLKRREGNGSRFVFPSKGISGRLENINYQIEKVEKETGIVFTLHDLRRTFTTVAESLDISSYTLARLLNHKKTDVTGGYIVAEAERLRGPMKRIAEALIKMIGPA